MLPDRAFLTHLAVQGKVAASTRNQALAALLVLYRQMLQRELAELGEVVRAQGAVSAGGVVARPCSFGAGRVGGGPAPGGLDAVRRRSAVDGVPAAPGPGR
jgi:hypothetical protein